MSFETPSPRMRVRLERSIAIGPGWSRWLGFDVRGREAEITLFEAPASHRAALRDTYLHERGSARAFRHPRAPRTLAVANGDEPPLIATARPPQWSLAEVLERASGVGIAVPLELVLSVGASVASLCRGLEHTPWRPGAAEGMHHGALALDRIYLGPDGALTIADVGLARTRLCLPPRPSVVSLMAPELADGPLALSSAADIHALGLILFGLIFGRNVFEHPTVAETRAAVLHGARPRLSRVRADLDADFEALIEWMLASRPFERPESFEVVSAHLVDAAERLLAGRDASPSTARWLAELMGVGAMWPAASDAEGWVEPLAAPPTGALREVDSFEPGIPVTSELPAVLAGAPAPVDVPIEPIVSSDLDFAGDLYATFSISEILTDPVEVPDPYVRLGPVGTAGLERAEHHETGRNVLFEFLPPHLDPSALDRRAEQLRALPRNPHLLGYLEHRREPSGSARVVSGFSGGEPLADRVRREGPLDLVEAQRLLEGLLAGLGHLHAHGLAHGALHPESILVVGTGAHLIARLGGLCQSLGGVALEEPTYLSPQRADGAAPSSSADVWALGAVLFEALTGQRPFTQASRLSFSDFARRSSAPLPSSLRPAARGFDLVVGLALRPDPEDRPDSASDLEQAVAHLQAALR